MKIYSVDECNKLLYQVIDKDYIFKRITVRGTVSNFHTHFLNFSFFTLLNDKSRISCFIGKARHTFLTRGLQSGKEISVVGDLKFDKTAGRPVLYVSRILDVKISAKQQQEEALKKELEAAGYFDPGNKRELPSSPFHIGIITSGSGAVIHDIIRTGRMRNDAVRYTLFNSLVQGEGAAAHLAEMVRKAETTEDPVDILIIARGGGAEEDLAPFAEKVLLDAVFSCRIPVISAVGHETDVTLLDRVADCRASTPTQAAEIAIPEKKALLEKVSAYLVRLQEIQQEIIRRQQLQVKYFFDILKSGKYFAYRQESHVHRIRYLLFTMQSLLMQRIDAGRREVRGNLSLAVHVQKNRSICFGQKAEFYLNMGELQAKGNDSLAQRKMLWKDSAESLLRDPFVQLSPERMMVTDLSRRLYSGNPDSMRVFRERFRDSAVLLGGKKLRREKEIRIHYLSLWKACACRITQTRERAEMLAAELLTGRAEHLYTNGGTANERE